MIIYLTDSLITSDPVKMRDIKDCIRNLCIAYSESKHLLLGDYNVLEWSKSNIKDETCQVVLNRLIQEFATSSISADITEYIEVGDWKDKILDDSGGRIIHKVPYSFFTDTRYCQKTELITEDENDAGLYRHILKWYIGSKNYNCDFRHCHGGGANMGRTIKTTLQDSRIAIAFVDTDIRFKGDKIRENSTCDKCIKAIKGVHNTSVFKLHILDVHEIENLLPLDIVTGFDWNQDSLFHFRVLVDLDSDGDILRFFDIKKGIVKNDDLIKDGKYRDFAKYCYSNNQALTEQCEFAKKIEEAENKSVIYPGLGQPLKKVIEYFNEHDIEKLDVSLKTFQKTEWDRIGGNLLNYCIASSKETLN